jgi:hypothetical protein
MNNILRIPVKDIGEFRLEPLAKVNDNQNFSVSFKFCDAITLTGEFQGALTVKKGQTIEGIIQDYLKRECIICERRLHDAISGVGE